MNKKNKKTDTIIGATIVSEQINTMNFANVTGKQGHGFAAEEYNTIYDNLCGKQASVIGHNNQKNGADRLANGIEMQTKYHATASRSVTSAFDHSTGQYRYYSQGKAMPIEVPYDQYDNAVNCMRNHIQKGQVSGVDDPSQAANLISRGNLTYEQAKRAAQFGNLDSLTCDAMTGIIVAKNAASIAFLANISICLAHGVPMEEALSQSLEAMANSATHAGVNTIAISQASKFIGQKLTTKQIQSFFSKNITKKAFLKTGATSLNCILINALNLYKGLISNHISKSQMIKNAIISSSALIAGSVTGSVPAAILVSASISKVIGLFIPDDIELMKPQAEKAFYDICYNFHLTEKETELLLIDYHHYIKKSSFWEKCHKQTKDATNKEKAYYNYMNESFSYLAESIVKQRVTINIIPLLEEQQQFNNEIKKVEQIQKASSELSQGNEILIASFKNNNSI